MKLPTIKCEPARIYALIVAVIGAAAAFGFAVDGEQQAAILAVVAAVLAIGQGEATRAKVMPVETIRQAGLNPRAVEMRAADPDTAPYG